MKGVCILSVSLLHMACDVISHEPMNIARFTFPILASMLLAGGLAIKAISSHVSCDHHLDEQHNLCPFALSKTICEMTLYVTRRQLLMCHFMGTCRVIKHFVRSNRCCHLCLSSSCLTSPLFFSFCLLLFGTCCSQLGFTCCLSCSLFCSSPCVAYASFSFALVCPAHHG